MMAGGTSEHTELCRTCCEISCHFPNQWRSARNIWEKNFLNPPVFMSFFQSTPYSMLKGPGLLILVVTVLLCRPAFGAGGVTLDVHLELGNEDFFKDLNDKLHQLLPYDEIDLRNIAMPHVTLYMTSFLNYTIPIVSNETWRVWSKMRSIPCPVQLTSITIQGAYAMWDVEVTPCMQKWSNSLVDALSPYIVPNQPIPDWVLDLPEPMRSEKISMIKKYGSPNVFDQFQAHVTLAWDNQEPMQPAFQKLNLQPMTVPSVSVAIGFVGPHGTVLRGGDILTLPLPH